MSGDKSKLAQLVAPCPGCGVPILVGIEIEKEETAKLVLVDYFVDYFEKSAQAEEDHSRPEAIGKEIGQGDTKVEEALKSQGIGSSVGIRTLTISFPPSGYFILSENGRYAELNWDELLAQVAELTHPRLSRTPPRYPMLTKEEWNYRERKMCESVKEKDSEKNSEYEPGWFLEGE